MRRVGVGVVDDDVENVDDEHDDRLHLLPVATRLLRDDEANAEDDEASADAIRDMMKIIITTTTTTTTVVVVVVVVVITFCVFVCFGEVSFLLLLFFINLLLFFVRRFKGDLSINQSINNNQHSFFSSLKNLTRAHEHTRTTTTTI